LGRDVLDPDHVRSRHIGRRRRSLGGLVGRGGVLGASRERDGARERRSDDGNDDRPPADEKRHRTPPIVAGGPPAMTLNPKTAADRTCPLPLLVARVYSPARYARVTSPPAASRPSALAAPDGTRSSPSSPAAADGPGRRPSGLAAADGTRRRPS